MPLSPDELRVYTGDIEAALKERIERHSCRFPDPGRLFRRLSDARDAASDEVGAGLRAFDEIHNEALVALALLEGPENDVRSLRYEPPLAGTEKSIDFRAEFDGSRIAHIDVKSIVPKAVDKWNQFQQAKQESWMPASARVALEEGSLGGELWHYGVAARAKMLEYSLELEAKIDFALRADPTAITILVLCSMGFHWSRDELEDFAGFYRTGVHRPDDPYSRMEAKHIRDKGIALSRQIGFFAFLERKQFDLDASAMSWAVAPPRLPW